MTRRFFALALVASLSAAACGGTTTAVEPSFETVTASSFAAIVDGGADGLVILDVRTPDEFGSGHIAGAVNIDFEAASFSSNLDQLAKDVPYAVYCRSGNRSAQAVSIMEQLGFTDVSELGGGIIAWQEAGYPIER